MSIEIYQIRAAWECVAERTTELAAIDRNLINIEETIYEAEDEVAAAWQDYLEILAAYIKEQK